MDPTGSGITHDSSRKSAALFGQSEDTNTNGGLEGSAHGPNSAFGNQEQVRNIPVVQVPLTPLHVEFTSRSLESEYSNFCQKRFAPRRRQALHFSGTAVSGYAVLRVTIRAIESKSPESNLSHDVGITAGLIATNIALWCLSSLAMSPRWSELAQQLVATGYAMAVAALLTGLTQVLGGPTSGPDFAFLCGGLLAYVSGMRLAPARASFVFLFASFATCISAAVNSPGRSAAFSSISGEVIWLLAVGLLMILVAAHTMQQSQIESRGRFASRRQLALHGLCVKLQGPTSIVASVSQLIQDLQQIAVYLLAIAVCAPGMAIRWRQRRRKVSPFESEPHDSQGAVNRAWYPWEEGMRRLWIVDHNELHFINKERSSVSRDVEDDEHPSRSGAVWGSDGLVERATLRGALVAVKRFQPPAYANVRRRGRGGKFISKKFLEELRLRAEICHQKVTRLVAVSIRPDEICFVTNYCVHGTVASLIRDPTKQFPWSLRLSWLADAASGLAGLHSCSPMVVHGNITSHALLVADNYHLYVDCGTQRQAVRPTEEDVEEDQAEVPGAEDVYAFGLIIWEVCTRRLVDVSMRAGSLAGQEGRVAPDVKGVAGYDSGGSLTSLASNSSKNEDNKETDGSGSLSQEINTIKAAHAAGEAVKIPKPLALLMQSCCTRDPTCRPTMNEVVEILDDIVADFHKSNTRSVEGVFATRDTERHHPLATLSSPVASTSYRALGGSLTRKLDYYSQIRTEDLILQEAIGRGAFGTVYRATFRMCDVAVKIFHKSSLDKRPFKERHSNAGMTEREGHTGGNARIGRKGGHKSKFDFKAIMRTFQDEASVIARLRHPNILQYLGACVTSSLLCIVTTYYPRGSLSEVLHGGTRKRGPLSWRYCLRAVLGTLRGLTYLHEMERDSMVHRDLKSANILLADNYEGIVADFGFTKLKQADLFKVRGGTFKYMAPEAITGKWSPCPEALDIYSVGIILAELATQRRPYADWLQTQMRTSSGRKPLGPPSKRDLLMRLSMNVGMKGLRPQVVPVPEDPDDPFQLWIGQIFGRVAPFCWHQDPGLRPSASRLVSFFGDVLRYAEERSKRTRDTKISDADTAWIRTQLGTLSASRSMAHAISESECLCVSVNDTSMGRQVPACADECVLIRSGDIMSCIFGMWRPAPLIEVSSPYERVGSPAWSLSSTQSTYREVHKVDAVNKVEVASFIQQLHHVIVLDHRSFVLGSVYITRCGMRKHGGPDQGRWKPFLMAAILLGERIVAQRNLTSEENALLLPVISAEMPGEIEKYCASSAQGFAGGIPAVADHKLVVDLVKSMTHQLLAAINFHTTVTVKTFSQFAQEFQGCRSVRPVDIQDSLDMERRSKTIEAAVKREAGELIKNREADRGKRGSKSKQEKAAAERLGGVPLAEQSDDEEGSESGGDVTISFSGDTGSTVSSQASARTGASSIFFNALNAVATSSQVAEGATSNRSNASQDSNIMAGGTPVQTFRQALKRHSNRGPSDHTFFDEESKLSSHPPPADPIDVRRSSRDDATATEVARTTRTRRSSGRKSPEVRLGSSTVQ